jgi:hypothetical protein
LVWHPGFGIWSRRRIQRFTSGHFNQNLQRRILSKTVRVYDLVTKRVNPIPAAELAPGMVEAQVEGVGRVWINSAEVKGGGKFKHRPFDSELRDFIERRRGPRKMTFLKTGQSHTSHFALRVQFR